MMRRFIILMLTLWGVTAALAMSRAPENPQGNLPLARQARIKEVVSPHEIDVYAVGIAGGPKKHRQSLALLDARRSAVYYLLYAGSDPLLGSETERARFEPLAQEWFAESNINRYIVYESPDFTQRVEIDKMTRLKLEKVMRVNVGLIKADLAKHGVTERSQSLAAQIGWPSIMVLPEVVQGSSPLALLEQDPRIKQGAAVIESYLTGRNYDVTVPQQSATLSALSSQMKGVAGIGDDPLYELALLLGSDIYIVFSLDVAERQLGGQTVGKVSATVRALETSTARLLGTETGYSKERPEPEPVLVEEAIKDAVDKVLNRIDAYWKEDRQRGTQYKLIINITGQFNAAQQLRFTNAIADFLASSCNHTKENVLSAHTMDFLIWARPDQYHKSRELANSLTAWLKESFPSGELVPININRKLILMELKNAGG